MFEFAGLGVAVPKQPGRRPVVSLRQVPGVPPHTRMPWCMSGVPASGRSRVTIPAGSAFEGPPIRSPHRWWGQKLRTSRLEPLRSNSCSTRGRCTGQTTILPLAASRAAILPIYQHIRRIQLGALSRAWGRASQAAERVIHRSPRFFTSSVPPRCSRPVAWDCRSASSCSGVMPFNASAL